VTEAGYREAGRLAAALAPTVLIQEGGYDLATLGQLAVAALTGAASAAAA
jgi:acetoin utilization deacetylase AcuC-like enzyme